MDSERRMTRAPNQSRAALARDAALARVGRTRRWVILATAALTAGFAALVSALAPGHSLAAKPQAGTAVAAATPSTGVSGSAIPAMPAPADPGSLGLQGPNETPAPAPSPQPSVPSAPPAAAPQSSGGGGAVVSGGS
jgi:hypothetical protein